MTTFEFGNRSVTLEDVFNANEPTREEMAAFCNSFGLMVENRVPLLEVICLTANSTTHPWFIALLSETYHGIREGQCLSDSMKSGLKRMTLLRVEELSKRVVGAESWKPEKSNRWTIPDLLGYFSDLIILMDAGEETGEVDTALLRTRDIYQNDGVVDSYEAIWGHDVSLFCSTFELMHSAGIPKLNCLKRLQENSPLRDEIQIAITEYEKGGTLAQALKATGGKLAHPALVAIIDAGESTDLLEMSLHRMQKSGAR